MRVLQAAVLHDTVEDTHTTIGTCSVLYTSKRQPQPSEFSYDAGVDLMLMMVEELVATFGIDVARIVQVRFNSCTEVQRGRVMLMVSAGVHRSPWSYGERG